MNDLPVQVVQLIRTTLLVRGKGFPEDPMRFVEQFWTLDGKLVAENDSHVLAKQQAVIEMIQGGSEEPKQ